MFMLAFGDLLGRRKGKMNLDWAVLDLTPFANSFQGIIMGGIIMIIGVIIQVTAVSGATPLAQFIVGRVVTGVGNGLNTSTIPTYQGSLKISSHQTLD